MPGPSRVVFFLVMFKSARREPCRIEVSLIPHVCGQQREVLPWDEPPHPSHSSCLLRELRLCALNRSSEMDSSEALSPPTNIYWIRHQGALMEWLDMTSVMVQPSSTLVPSLETQGSCISNRHLAKRKAVRPSLFLQQKYGAGPTSGGPGANQRHSLQHLVETRNQRPQGLSFSLMSCA